MATAVSHASADGVALVRHTARAGVGDERRQRGCLLRLTAGPAVVLVERAENGRRVGGVNEWLAWDQGQIGNIVARARFVFHDSKSTVYWATALRTNGIPAVSSLCACRPFASTPSAHPSTSWARPRRWTKSPGTGRGVRRRFCRRSIHAHGHRREIHYLADQPRDP